VQGDPAEGGPSRSSNPPPFFDELQYQAAVKSGASMEAISKQMQEARVNP